MYQKFTVESVRVIEADHVIKIGFTFDVNEDSVNDSSVYVTRAETIKPIVMSSVTVDGPTVTLEYESLNVNTDYEICVTRKVESIMDEPLAIEFKKIFCLKSKVDSTVDILAPIDHEELKTPSFTFKEIAGKSKKLFNRFRVQIASDYGFYDIIHESVLDSRSELSLSTLKPAKQYFIRIRVESNDNEFGNWSDIHTFTMRGEPKPDYTEHDDVPKKKGDITSEDEPIFEDVFEIVGYPENGTTPEGSFLIEFESDIDPSSIDIANILLTRKKV